MNERPIYERLADRLESAGPGAMLTDLADYLIEERRFHELFEVRKLLVRDRLGLAWVPSTPDEPMDEATREKLEEGLVAACREVGLGLLRSGRLRDGWHYLRVVGDRGLVQQELSAIEPQDDNIDEFVELCVHEGLDLPRGFRLLLRHYGTCNSITTFESVMYGRSRSDRAAGAALIVEHLYDELRAGVSNHIQRQEGAAPDENLSLTQLCTGRDWLFAGGAYHVDTTHLASVVRLARDLTEPRLLRLARELADYGSRLEPSLQYPGEPPFEQLYPATSRYLSALLGHDEEAHLEYFRERAEGVNPHEETTQVIEIYIDLLARLGQPQRALEESLRLLPDGVHPTGRAPTLLDLAAASGQFTTVTELARQRKDLVGYALCLLQASRP
jgi:hypothetical protein